MTAQCQYTQAVLFWEDTRLDSLLSGNDSKNTWCYKHVLKHAVNWAAAGVSDLVDAGVAFSLLLGGGVQAPERGEAALALAGRARHGVCAPPYSTLCASCHLQEPKNHTRTENTALSLETYQTTYQKKAHLFSYTLMTRYTELTAKPLERKGLFLSTWRNPLFVNQLKIVR